MTPIVHSSNFLGIGTSMQPGSIFSWLHAHLLPCPIKFLTGYNCPGCGFQRSLLALLQGDITRSWALYPATIPLLILFASAVLQKRGLLDRKGIFLKGQAAVCFVIVYGFFLLK